MYTIILYYYYYVSMDQYSLAEWNFEIHFYWIEIMEWKSCILQMKPLQWVGIFSDWGNIMIYTT